MRLFDVRLALVAGAFAVVSCGNDHPNDSGGSNGTVGDERVVLEVQQYLSNHNGGSLFFGADGYLYLGLGDGGGGGDNEDNAQDRTTLLGSILRIAVDPSADAAPYYSIPPDNPFVGNADGWREEIFAYGLRNPWRVTQDGATGAIWAGDVGQNVYEEVDTITSGGNYGWDCREGMHDYTGPGTPSPLCASATGLIDPVFEYVHGSGNISITGGYVYHGSAAPGLAGKYVYADYGSGRVWALSIDPAVSNEDVVDAPFPISSFGVDEAGELYVLQYSATGKIYRVADAGGGTYQLVDAFPDLTFANPVDLKNAGDGSGRLFVLEQAGRVMVFDTSDPKSAAVYLDLTDSVACCGEQGLLGLAFHPEFAANGIAYVYYTSSDGGSLVGRLSRIKVE
jgi:glucose/arabinose dehydrogenase